MYLIPPEAQASGFGARTKATEMAYPPGALSGGTLRFSLYS